MSVNGKGLPFIRGNCHYSLSNLDRAMDDWGNAVKLSKGDYKKALEHYQKALAIRIRRMV